ncbi:MerR family transcriptional regulator [Patescibacteria group bacterium]|nr:MerR family transcriptional regulator [Patescibacteria group bacterium]
MEKEQEVYNLTKLADKLGVPRQTVYYWIEKGWVKPKRDYRNYPVFTAADLKKIIKWKTTLKS